MAEYFEAITDARTGEVTMRPFTAEEAAAKAETVATAAVPASVTPRQVRLLLLSKGLLDQVEALIAQQDRQTQITWEFASEFQRNDPLLVALGASLGLSSQQIDEFFVAAASI